MISNKNISISTYLNILHLMDTYKSPPYKTVMNGGNDSIKFLSFEVLEVSVMDHNLLWSFLQS